MEFGLFDDVGEAELTSLSLVGISKIFAAQDDFFHGATLFDRVYLYNVPQFLVKPNLFTHILPASLDCSPHLFAPEIQHQQMVKYYLA